MPGGGTIGPDEGWQFWDATHFSPELPVAEFANVRDWFARVTEKDVADAWAKTDPAR